MKILLAVDGSTCSDVAVEEVARRPWPAGSEVRIVSVVEPPMSFTPEVWAVPPGYFEEAALAAHARARVVLDKAAATLEGRAGAALKVTTVRLEGSAKQAILDEAGRQDVDLIVVGSRGINALERFLLGSVSQALTLHAKCSVEIVRCRDRYDAGQGT